MRKEQLGDLIIDSQESLYRVAKTLLYNDADCADAISETIVRAFAKLHTLRQDGYAKTWLTKILINECYAIMRKEKKIVYLEDFPQEEQSGEREDYSELYEALSHLSEETRITVTLYYMEGYGVKEIARLLGISESAVKSRLKRARERLRDEMEEVN